MGRIIDKIPVLNIFSVLWKWSDGDEYTIDDDKTILPPELAESDRLTDASYEQHFKKQTNKGNGGKGKSQFKLDKGELNTEKPIDLSQETGRLQKQKEGQERE